jgi:hypothetical protein
MLIRFQSQRRNDLLGRLDRRSMWQVDFIDDGQ